MKIEGLKKALLIILSAPFKPGSIHRFQATREFEARLVEAVVVSGFMEEAWERGDSIRRGRLDTASSGLGDLIHSALVKSYEEIDEEPLAGLASAAITISMVKGLAGGPLEGIKPTLLYSLLYSRGGAQASRVVEALETIGASRLVEALDKRGLTKRVILLESRSIGEVFEALSSVDSGFWINARWYRRVVEAYKTLSRARTVTEAALTAYLAVGRSMGLLDLDPEDIKGAVSTDRRMGRRRELDAILGGAFLALSLAIDSKGLWRV